MAQATSSGISRVICTAMMMMDCFSVQCLECLLQLMNFLFCKGRDLWSFVSNAVGCLLPVVELLPLTANGLRLTGLAVVTGLGCFVSIFIQDE